MGLYLEKIEENEKKIKKLKADGLTDSDNDITADTTANINGYTDSSDDEFGQQMSFTDKRNPYED